VDRFEFWDYPVRLPDFEPQETNVYDMRLVRHEDGWIYGTFCAERHDDARPGDLSAAIARCGIARTRDLVAWERLPDLKTGSPHQRNCVLHPEFINGKYAFYTRPMSDFAATGTGDGIGWGLCDDITHAAIEQEQIIDRAPTTPSRKARTASARPRSRRRRAGCTWRTACATRPPGCAMCSTCSCATCATPPGC